MSALSPLFRAPAPVFWLTGLPGAGKTTLGKALADRLQQEGISVLLLDGDRLRAGVCSDLGFSLDDRSENVRRAAEIAALVAEQGMVAVAALISPLAAGRQQARRRVPGPFHEIFVDAPLATCVGRDPKMLYSLATNGQVKQLTGLDSPYQPPANPDLRIDTAASDLDAAIGQLCAYALGHVRVCLANQGLRG